MQGATSTDRKVKTQLSEQMSVRLPLRTLILSLRSIESGAYESMDKLVDLALNKLLTDDESPRDPEPFEQVTADIRSAQLHPTSKKASSSATRHHMIALQGDLHLPTAASTKADGIRTNPPSSIQSMAVSILPLTVQKIWPSKLVLRELAAQIAEAGTTLVPVMDFSPHIARKSYGWHRIADNLDRERKRPRGERLAANLPSNESTRVTGLDRFLNATIGQIYRDGRQTGALPFLGFTVLVQEGPQTMVGITGKGLEFAQLENPVADLQTNAYPPFSETECAFILEVIESRCSVEAGHMAFYLAMLLDQPGIGREESIRRMRSYYERIWNPLNLTREMVDSYRGGVNSRCVELGLARTERADRRAGYVITEAGLQWLTRVRR